MQKIAAGKREWGNWKLNVRIRPSAIGSIWRTNCISYAENRGAFSSWKVRRENWKHIQLKLNISDLLQLIWRTNWISHAEKMRASSSWKVESWCVLLQLVHPPNLRSTYEYTIAPITLGSPQSGTRFSMKFTRSYFPYMLSLVALFLLCLLISAVLSNIQTDGHLECEEAYSKTQICFVKYLERRMLTFLDLVFHISSLQPSGAASRGSERETRRGVWPGGQARSCWPETEGHGGGVK